MKSKVLPFLSFRPRRTSLGLASVLWFSLLLLFLPTQLGLHFWPDYTRVLGLRIDYLAPTLYFTDVLVFLLLACWGKELLFERNVGEVENPSQIPKFRLLDFARYSTASGFARRIIKHTSLFKVSLFLCFSVFVVLNILLAHSPTLALLKWLRFTELALLFLYIQKSKFFTLRPKFLILISLAILYVSLITIAQFLLQHSLGGPFWLLGERSLTASTPGIAKVNLCQMSNVTCQMFLRPYATFSHPNSLAGFLLVSLILLLGLQKKFSAELACPACPPLEGAQPKGSPRLDLPFTLRHHFLSSLRGAIPNSLQISWRRGNPVCNSYRSILVTGYWLTVALGTIALALTFSRTAYLATAVVLLLWLAFRLLPKLSNLLLTVFLTSFFLFSFLSPFTLSPLGSLWPQVTPGVDAWKLASESIKHRLTLFQAAQNIIKSKPLLGVGLNNFIPALPQHLPVPPTLPLLQPVHNLWWLILAETGLLGLLFALWGLFTTFKHVSLPPVALAKGGHLPSTTYYLMLIAILITGSTDHYWFTLPQNQLLLTVVLGLIWQNKTIKPVLH